MIAFVIPLNPASKKNGSQICTRGGKNFLIPNKTYLKYEKEALLLIPSEVRVKVNYPVNVKALYYRDSRRRVDKTNLENALHDVLVKANVLMDDSAINPVIIVSTDGSRVLYDKENPRTEVYIEEAKGEFYREEAINKK